LRRFGLLHCRKPLPSPPIVCGFAASGFARPACGCPSAFGSSRGGSWPRFVWIWFFQVFHGVFNHVFPILVASLASLASSQARQTARQFFRVTPRSRRVVLAARHGFISPIHRSIRSVARLLPAVRQAVPVCRLALQAWRGVPGVGSLVRARSGGASTNNGVVTGNPFVDCTRLHRLFQAELAKRHIVP
jgi:hypothetical protein